MPCENVPTYQSLTETCRKRQCRWCQVELFEALNTICEKIIGFLDIIHHLVSYLKYIRFRRQFYLRLQVKAYSVGPYP
jgi:hypothetical protein